MSRADRIPRSEWDSNKEHIRALYLDQDKSLDDLVTSMSEEHDFHATISENWAPGMKKYSSKEDWKHADTLIRKRKVEGKDTEIFINGKLVSAKKLKKELGRYAWQQPHGQQSLAKDAPEGVIARTPPSSTMAFIVGRSIPWFRFQDHLHSFMARNSPMDPGHGALRLVISPSAKQLDILPFLNKVLITASRTKTLSEATSIIEGQMPRSPDLDATSQVGRHGSDPLSLALQWAVYRCTNNHLSSLQIDEFLGFIAESGNLAALKGICRMPGPTTKTLLSKLLPSAIRLRDFALASFLLDQGVDPEARHSDSSFSSILQKAARDHNDDVVQLLLEHGTNPEDANKDGCTPLQSALMEPGGLSTVKLLVQAGADVNPPSRGYYESSLMMAVAQLDMEAVKFLIDAGADPNRGDRLHYLRTIRHISCLPLAAAARLNTRGGITKSSKQSQNRCQRQIIDLLLQAGANVNAIPSCAPRDSAVTAMQAAAESGNFDICSLFISHGGDIHAPAIGEYGMTCLQAAAFSGNVDIVYLLLGMGVDVNEAGLHAAASSGNMELVNLFLDMDANVNQQTPKTALEVAIDAGHNDVVERLLDAGADVNQNHRFGSALFSAARKQDAKLVGLLMAQGADLEPVGCHVSPLIAAIEQEWAYGARLLIQAGADVNRPCTKPDFYSLPEYVHRDQTVPLVEAVLTREVKFVQMLLDAGAKLHAHSSRCLELAIQNRSNDIVRLLLQNGVNPNQIFAGEEAVTPIHAAIIDKDEFIETDVLKTLIEFGANVNACSEKGYPLEIVSNVMLDLSELGWNVRNLEEARDILLRAGADPSLFNNDCSELQLAAKKGDIARVQSLILNGEDVNEPANGKRGATALQYAAMYGHLNIAMLLIENGALINAPKAGIDGRTALQAAAENGRLDIVHLLLEHDDELGLLEERCFDAAEYAEEEGHRVIAQILREWRRS
ncbi:Clr5 domain-containing protein [Fusarium falciforme]|uniref:Clr5 domain-containing protein n=1 Tax=Fusarium falciforme TaxID=195108 RepID=UPI0023016305|nr:Clr5 domain-containing protein [Fusarium falciforme]WAO96178.1 Clr5 domain-containing protein [Fusarium falciforme]